MEVINKKRTPIEGACSKEMLCLFVYFGAC